MPIYHGSEPGSPIGTLYYGSTSIGRAYYGTTLVFDKTTSGGGGATHRFWRLRFPDGAVANTNSRLAIQEIEYRGTAGGPDLLPAYATNATYISHTLSSFGSSQFSGTYTYRNAYNDTATGNPWVTANSGMSNSWIGFDWANATGGIPSGLTPPNIREIAVTVPTSASGFFTPPLSIVVEWSDDGTTWTPEWTISGPLSWSSGETKVFTKP